MSISFFKAEPKVDTGIVHCIGFAGDDNSGSSIGGMDIGFSIFRLPRNVLGWDAIKKRLYFGCTNEHFLKLDKTDVGSFLIGSLEHDFPFVMKYLQDNEDLINDRLVEALGEEFVIKGIELKEVVDENKKALEPYNIETIKCESFINCQAWVLCAGSIFSESVRSDVGVFLDLSFEEETNPDFMKEVIKKLTKRGMAKKYKEWEQYYKIASKIFPIAMYISMELKRHEIILDLRGHRVIGIEDYIDDMEKTPEFDVIQMTLGSFEKIGDYKYRIKFKNLEDLKEQVGATAEKVLTDLNLV